MLSIIGSHFFNIEIWKNFSLLNNGESWHHDDKALKSHNSLFYIASFIDCFKEVIIFKPFRIRLEYLRGMLYIKTEYEYTPLYNGPYIRNWIIDFKHGYLSYIN